MNSLSTPKKPTGWNCLSMIDAVFADPSLDGGRFGLAI